MNESHSLAIEIIADLICIFQSLRSGEEMYFDNIRNTSQRARVSDVTDSRVLGLLASQNLSILIEKGLGSWKRPIAVPGSVSEIKHPVLRCGALNLVLETVPLFSKSVGTILSKATPKKFYGNWTWRVKTRRK